MHETSIAPPTAKTDHGTVDEWKAKPQAEQQQLMAESTSRTITLCNTVAEIKKMETTVNNMQTREEITPEQAAQLQKELKDKHHQLQDGILQKYRGMADRAKDLQTLDEIKRQVESPLRIEWEELSSEQIQQFNDDYNTTYRPKFN